MSIKYENENVMVDATRYIVNGKTYPINNITSVEMGEIQHGSKEIRSFSPEKAAWTLGLHQKLFFGSIWAFVGIALGSEFFWPGYVDRHYPPHKYWEFLVATPIVLGLVGLIMSKTLYSPSSSRITGYKPIPSDFVVRITTASGRVDSYTSRDEYTIEAIIEAINKAIIERG